MTDLALWKANGDGLWGTGSLSLRFIIYVSCVLAVLGSVAAQRPPLAVVCVLRPHSAALGSAAAPQGLSSCGVWA